METSRLNAEDCEREQEGLALAFNQELTENIQKSRRIEAQRKEIERLTSAVTNLSEDLTSLKRSWREVRSENSRLADDLFHTSEAANAHQRALEFVIATYVPLNDRVRARAFVTGYLNDDALEGGPFDDIRERSQHAEGGTTRGEGTERCADIAPDGKRQDEGRTEVLCRTGELFGRDSHAA